MPECCLFLANAGRSLRHCVPQLPLLQEMLAALTFWGCRQFQMNRGPSSEQLLYPRHRLASCQELVQESGVRVSILGTCAGRVRHGQGCDVW